MILDYSRRHDLQLDQFPSAEAQAAAIADDIAYDAHDIDDGLRAGLFGADELAVVPFIAGIIDEVDTAYPELDEFRRGHEIVRRIITRMIEDVIAQSRQQLASLEPRTADDVRGASATVVTLSAAMAETDRAIKSFLKPRMYAHDRVMRVMNQADKVLRDLFDAYVTKPEELPPDRRQRLGNVQAQRFRQIGNFIAGMTDRFALIEHKRIFDSTPELR